ncbi:MAG: GDP-L-fucose synthase [Chlorobium limicola]|uniref:GDP-L-fucose synthase family protein n=1 Tax=Chlorobium limicola TaxID=1092 RepID=UPI0023F0C8C8|nr:GDP-L-fucose synthase [Chlorobium limicola]NTV20898.1 GDP-L-fucose synthase [Chlorobium limicola]
MLSPNSLIYVAGHNGMVGSAIIRRLKLSGYSNILTKRRSELDLVDQKQVFSFLQHYKPDYIVSAAAKVGGILANNTYRAEFIYENLVIEANLIHGAWLAGVKDLLFLGSSCIYPKFAPQPMPEECLLSGELEYTNEPYAIAKIAGIKLCESYNLQYGTNYLSVMPTNLYGTNDNFDLEKSHVLPAMLRKFHLGRCLMDGDRAAIRRDFDKNPVGNIDGSASDEELAALLDSYGVSLTCNGSSSVTLWGTGTPRREFLWSDDLADACVFIMEKVKFSDTYEAGSREVRNTHINIGTGEDISIRDLAETIMRITGYRGSLRFDASKPDGTPRKLQDVGKLTKLGWRHSVALEDGIARMYRDYCSA